MRRRLLWLGVVGDQVGLLWSGLDMLVLFRSIHGGEVEFSLHESRSLWLAVADRRLEGDSFNRSLSRRSSMGDG